MYKSISLIFTSKKDLLRQIAENTDPNRQATKDNSVAQEENTEEVNQNNIARAESVAIINAQNEALSNQEQLLHMESDDEPDIDIVDNLEEQIDEYDELQEVIKSTSDAEKDAAAQRLIELNEQLDVTNNLLNSKKEAAKYLSNIV